MMRFLSSPRRTGFAILGSLASAALTTTTVLAQGGDTPNTAVPLALGVPTFGTTVGYNDDSDEVCPYTGSTSPDVYYRFGGSGEFNLNVSLCESGYDTKVYVYDQDLQLIELADASGPSCNDDACSSSGGGGFRSRLACVPPPPPGEVIYIVVDGWNGDAGPYQILLTESPPDGCEPFVPCELSCPPGAIVEGEPCRFGDPAPNDTHNGGCNAEPPSFQDLACGETLCGQAYFDGTFRDTDWFRVDARDLYGPVSFELTGVAEFGSVYAKVCQYGDPLVVDCTVLCAFDVFGVFEPCTPVSVTTELPYDPEVYYFFVTADFDEVVDCNEPDGMPGADYLLEVICTGAAPPCPWDLDGDGQVGFADLLEILSYWGPCPTGA